MKATVRLIRKQHVKAYALEMAKARAHKFTRVGAEFYVRCEGMMKAFIRGYIHRLPSVGKTIK